MASLQRDAEKAETNAMTTKSTKLLESAVEK